MYAYTLGRRARLGTGTWVVQSQFNMKFMVLAACVAVSSAQLVTYPNGAVVPADEPAVALAKAQHLAAGGAVHAYAGAYPYAYNGYANGYAGYAGYPGAYGYAAYPYAAAGAYPYAQALVAHANGAVVPVDEPAVLAAKAEHFAAHGIAHPALYAGAYAGALPYAHGLAYAGLVAHPNGAIVPAEPADVVAARAEHLAAHAAA